MLHRTARTLAIGRHHQIPATFRRYFFLQLGVLQADGDGMMPGTAIVPGERAFVTSFAPGFVTTAGWGR